MLQNVRLRRKRFKQAFPLKERLERAARECRKVAESALSQRQRDQLVRDARRYEVTAQLDAWLSSPGLRPPK